MKHSFGSDNHSGVHPYILDAIAFANRNYAVSYGEDPYTIGVLSKIENLFDNKYQAFFTLTGTGANILALSSITAPVNSIICPDTAHINVDECGSPERLTGCKLISVPNRNGKILPEDIIPKLTGFGTQHHSQPKVLAISQVTEMGTVYTPQEIRELTDLMHKYNCLIFIDGSRLANAAAFLKLPLKSFTSDLDIDAFSFGGTKNGLMIGEVVLIAKRLLKQTNNVIFFRKQMSQLYSKMRFVAAQYDAYLENDLYLKLATKANEMASYLREKLSDISRIRFTCDTQANAVFAVIDKDLYNKLIEKHYFYIWDEQRTEVRWMTSFSTTKEDIDNFANDIIN